MRRTLLYTAALALLGSSAFAAPEGPPFFDPDRSLDKQKAAAKEAVAAATAGGVKKALPYFADLSVRVRDEVLKSLVKQNDSDLLAAMRKYVGHRDPFVAATIAELYGQCRFSEGREALEKFGLRSKDEAAVLEAIWALEAIGDPLSAKVLEKTHKRKHSFSEYRVQGDALIALAVVDPERAQPHIEKALSRGRPPLQIAGLVALGRFDARRAADAAVTLVSAKAKARSQEAWEGRVLFASLEALSSWHARSLDADLFARAMGALIARLGRAEALSRHEIAMALADLSGSALGDDPEIWKSWWEPRKDDFEPKDKVVKKKKRKKKKKKKKDADADAKKRPETGGGTRVRFHGIPIYSDRIVFAQDVSGGMTKEKVDNKDPESPSRMEFSIKELKRVIQKLPDEVMMNVVFFATRFEATNPRLFPIKKARAALLEFVSKKSVTPKGKSMSRSNLYDTLQFAMNDPDTDTIYFLSEGGPSSGRYLDRPRFIRHLARLNVYRRVQVHTLQVSSTPWGRKFLRAISECTGGQFYDVEFLTRNHGS